MSSYKFNETQAPKAVLPKKKGKKGHMPEEDVQRIISALITDAQTLVDSELEPERQRATDYYHGEPFGNEEPGRSQFVLTEVRDTIHGTIPSIMRIAFGAKRAVEFVPRNAAGVALAKQATDYVQYVFVEDNAGFLRTREVLLDGMIRRHGIFKWGWEDGRVVGHEEESVSEERLYSLAERDDVNFTSIEPHDDNTSDVCYTVKTDGRARVWSLPPEEFIFGRHTKDENLAEALICGHRTEKSRGELLALGYDEEFLEEHGARDAALETSTAAVSRNPASSQTDPEAGEANDAIGYFEGYALIDVDGDGTAELRQICTIGPGHKIARNLPADDAPPFAIFMPYPEPHSLAGGKSTADLTMDIQRAKSMVARGIFDSFALSIFPRTTVLEGLASIEDVLNTEIGAPIRIKRDGAVVPFSHPFTGGDAMPILAFFDGVTESRVGKAKGAMGLDADALQSSTSQAVGAAVQGSQEQTEMLARLFVEQVLKPLFRGIYRLLVRHQPKERVVKLRGQWVEIKVAEWDAEMDVTVTVALGTSHIEERKAALMGIAEKQESIIQMMGPANPFCSLSQLRHTYAELVELCGHPDVSSFFNEIDPNWQPPQAEPQKSPEQVLAEAQLQIEQMRTQKDLEIKQAELSMKQEQQHFDQQFQIAKMAQDNTLRRYEIEAKYKHEFEQAQLDRDAAAEEVSITTAMDIHKQHDDAAHAEHERGQAEQAQSHEQELAEAAQAHDQKMAEQQASQAAAEPQA